MQLLVSLPLVLLGIISLTHSSFAQLYLAIHIVVLLIMVFLSRGNDETSKRIRLLALCIMSLAVVFHWLSIWGSYQILPVVNEVTHNDVFAIAGFPLHTFNYPYPPMGGDVPPIASWPWFYGNELFWMLTAAGVVALFKKTYSNKQTNLYHFGYCRTVS